MIQNSSIISVPFQKRQESALECEVLRLEHLFRRKIDTYLSRPQRQTFYMMCWIIKGEGEHTLDFRSYRYQQGNLIFITPGQIHKFHPSLDVEGIAILFTDRFFSREDSDRFLLSSSHLFNLWSQTPVLVPPPEQHGCFDSEFRELEEEYLHGKSDSFRESLLRSIIRTIFLRAERLKQTDLSPEAIGNFPEFLRFKDLVEHDFKRTRSVIDYTSKLGLSTRKLNRITQHVLGMNAKEIIDARIILEIQRLLSHSQMSLKEITDALGFDESTNLVKYFRKRNGNTPMEFRSTLGNNGIFLP